MIERLLERMAKALTASRIPFMLIGGQAVLFYGYPRLTRDVDVTLGVGPDASATLLDVCRKARLTPLVKQPQAFVRTTHVLPAEDRASGLRVDFIFSDTRYERQAIRRAHRVRVGRATVPFASLDDLLIHKLVAGRAVDLEDVRVLMARHRGTLDSRYVRRWLRRFVVSGALPHDPLAAFDQLRRSASRSSSR